MPADDIDVVVEIVAAARHDGARIVGVTGGIAVGKSTVAAAVASELGHPTVSTDGFIRVDAGARKGYADSYDSVALQEFVDGFRVTGSANAPRYSHLHYEVTSYAAITGEGLVLDGLHLGHPKLGLRNRIDLLVHLDAPTEILAGWYLARFEQLRADAANDPTAMLYPYRDLDAATMNGTAMQVWHDLNAVVIEDEIRPMESVADVVVRIGADHVVREVIRR